MQEPRSGETPVRHRYVRIPCGLLRKLANIVSESCRNDAAVSAAKGRRPEPSAPASGRDAGRGTSRAAYNCPIRSEFYLSKQMDTGIRYADGRYRQSHDSLAFSMRFGSLAASLAYNSSKRILRSADRPTAGNALAITSGYASVVALDCLFSKRLAAHPGGHAGRTPRRPKAVAP